MDIKIIIGVVVAVLIIGAVGFCYHPTPETPKKPVYIVNTNIEYGSDNSSLIDVYIKQGNNPKPVSITITVNMYDKGNKLIDTHKQTINSPFDKGTEAIFLSSNYYVDHVSVEVV